MNDTTGNRICDIFLDHYEAAMVAGMDDAGLETDDRLEILTSAIAAAAGHLGQVIGFGCHLRFLVDGMEAMESEKQELLKLAEEILAPAVTLACEKTLARSVEMVNQRKDAAKWN